jgi:hypothetical protein
LTLFVTLLLTSYFFYIPFDAWWFLRFILPAYPIVLVLATGCFRSMRLPLGRTAHFFLMAAVLTFVWGWELTSVRSRAVFDLQQSEQRYVTVGRELATTTPANAVFIAMQESGSLRYYTGRVTVRWNALRPDSLDQAMEVLRARGFRPYFLLEDWEEAGFRERFGQTSRAGGLDWPPMKRWRFPVSVALYDPAVRDPLAAARGPRGD